MAKSLRPRAPEGLGKAGKRLWRKLVTDLTQIEYRPDELLILEEAAYTADTLEALRAEPQDSKTLVEMRLQQEQLRKLLRSVTFPEDEDDDGRGRSASARTLAMARWRR